MRLVVGLGNPGPKYERTRHNIGFMVADELAYAGAGSWRDKFKGHFAKVSLGGSDCVLLKPQTFMNLSGESVQPAAAFFGVDPAHVIVVHDELDLPFGKVRVKFKGGHAGHNGLRSISQHIGADYVRVRCGIGRPVKGDPVQWVLGGFGVEESPWLPDFIQRAAGAVKMIAEAGVQAAMNHYNTEPKDK